jgi:GGDEF domain-containing protein
MSELRNRTVCAKSTRDGLMQSLIALKERGYVAPRIYHKRGDLCHLVMWQDLPKRLTEGRPSFPVNHPIIRQLVEQNSVYHNTNIKADLSFDWGRKDPMHYINAKGLVAVPFAGKSNIYPAEIRGLFVVNYHPSSRDMGTTEVGLLARVGQLMGIQVTNLMEEKVNRIRVRRLEVAVSRLRNKELELERANQFLASQLQRDSVSVYSSYTFHEDLKNNLSKTKIEGRTYFLNLMNLDHLRELNIHHGMRAGDQFIDNVMAYLKTVPAQARYRVASDTFALVIELNEATTDHSIIRWADGIRNDVKNLPVPPGCKPISVSQALVMSHPEYPSAHFWTLKAKDVLLQAKTERNRIAIYTPAIPGAEVMQY